MKEEQAAAEQAVTLGNFREWTMSAPEVTALPPEVPDWSEGVQVPIYATGSSLLKTGVRC